MLRVAIIRREFITHLDGVNRFIANLAEGLKVLGYEVLIASWSYKGIEAQHLAKWFKEVHGLDYEFDIYALRGPEERDKWVTMMHDWFTKGSKLLKDLDVDVAIVNGVVPLRFKPKVAVVHGPLIRVPRLHLAVLKSLYETYDHVVCVSKASEKEYKGITKCDEIIPLPLKLKNFKPLPFSDRENVIVHVGTRAVKNPQISIRAVEILREKGYDVSLVIVGFKSTYVEELCRNKSFVTLMFNVNENEKNEVLCKAKALILPSSGETFSYASLEAMACGTPLVVSSAVPDDVVIHGYNGLRINSLDPQAYANALEEILRDRELWLNYSKNALEHVKQFSYVRIAKKYAELLKHFVKS